MHDVTFSPTTHCHLFRFNKRRVFKYLHNREDVSNLENGIDLTSGTALGDQTDGIDKTLTDVELHTQQSSHGDQEETADQLDGQSSVKPKRPNLLKVLKGTQWSKSLRDGQLHATTLHLCNCYQIYSNFCLKCLTKFIWKDM